MKKTIIVLLCLLAILLTACSSNITGDVVLEDGEVKISISSITSELTKYTHDYNGKTITYFAVLGSDGEVRTAFDACDVCGGYLGYTQRGSDVECIKCGRVFSIDALGESNTGGGCWPSNLDFTTEGDYIVISEADLESKAYMF